MHNGSKHNFIKTINHQQPEKVVVDFGATTVTGIHVLIVEKLRDYFGLEKKPVKVIEPYQMLGEIDDELVRAMDIDVTGLFGEKNMFGVVQDNWKVHRTLWGQEVLFPGEFNYNYNDNGDILMYPEGDRTAEPCAMMPKSGYFFDALERQEPIDESILNIEDNLEEFGLVTRHDLEYWEKQIESVDFSSKGIVATMGSTALGDIALVPGVGLKHPKGIRSVSEWYMSTLTREEFIKELYEKQTDIAIENLKRLYKVVGNRIDVAYICGTDFGTQNSTFCSPETYRSLWLPYYRKVNDWIHENTSWKTFKHSCGAIESFLDLFIESGFDIINPVQINASGMDSCVSEGEVMVTGLSSGVEVLTPREYFPFGTPAQVREQVKRPV